MVTTDLGACEWFVWDLRRSNLLDRGQLDQIVGEFLEKGFRFVSVGNDLHHILTQSGAYVNDIEKVAKEKCKAGWTRRPTALF